MLLFCTLRNNITEIPDELSRYVFGALNPKLENMNIGKGLECTFFLQIKIFGQQYATLPKCNADMHSFWISHMLTDFHVVKLALRKSIIYLLNKISL